MELFTGVNYLEALTQQYGGGLYVDRKVFNTQEGNGFSNWFSSLGQFAMPVLQKVLPFLKNIGKSAIKGGVDYAVGKSVQQAAAKIGNKRKKPFKYSTSKHRKLA